MSGIGEFIYDYQTLLTGIGALGAAYFAGRPVYQQLSMMRTQSNGVLREMLLNRQSELDQAKLALSEHVKTKIRDVLSEMTWIDAEELTNEQAFSHYQVMVTSSAWLSASYHWRNSEAVERCRMALIRRIEAVIDILDDAHLPGTMDQHDEDRSIPDEDWAKMEKRAVDARLEIKPACRIADKSYASMIEAIDADIGIIKHRLKKVDAALLQMD